MTFTRIGLVPVPPSRHPNEENLLGVRVNGGKFDVTCAIQDLKRFSISLKERKVKKSEECDKGSTPESRSLRSGARDRLEGLYNNSVVPENGMEHALLKYMKDPNAAVSEMLTEFRLSFGRTPGLPSRREFPEVRPGLLRDVSRDLSKKLELICGRRLSNQRRTYST